jgi:hypothetical protein
MKNKYFHLLIRYQLPKDKETQRAAILDIKDKIEIVNNYVAPIIDNDVIIIGGQKITSSTIQDMHVLVSAQSAYTIKKELESKGIRMISWDFLKKPQFSIDITNQVFNSVRIKHNYQSNKSSIPTCKKVLLGHDNGDHFIELEAFLKQQLDLDVTVIHSFWNTDLHSIEYLENSLKECCIAFLIISDEDYEFEQIIKIIHIVGFFQGILGNMKVIFLIEENFEKLPNLAGIVQKRFPPDGFEVILEELQEVIERVVISEKIKGQPILVNKHSITKEMREKCHSLVADDDILQSLDLLLNLVDKNSPEFHQVILLKRNLRQIETENDIKVIDTESYFRRRSQIAKAVLNLIGA